VKAYFEDESVTLYHGDALDVAREMPSGSVNCVVTSPPYFGLRDYGPDGQYGLEASPAEYVETMRALFAELRRVLTDDGTLWLNIGDSYSAGGQGGNLGGNLGGGAHLDKVPKPTRVVGMPPKNLLGIPWRVAFALQADGWILRNDIIWHKTNAMPESVGDRLSSRHEHVFMFSKSRRYWFDLNAIREPVTTTSAAALSFARDTKETDVPGQRYRQHRSDRRSEVHGKAAGVNLAPTGARHTAQHSAGRNPGDVWSIPTKPFADAHFAVMAIDLAERCVLAGCKPSGTVLDPFSGSGTTGLAAAQNGRQYVGIELNSACLELSLRTRLAQPGLFGGVQ
jgi:site-specific DNA-methyltransferase (cytosine-N4-specific)